jgi:hypothetical protein
VHVHFDNVTQSLNKHVAAFVCERCSILTEFLVGYGADQRRELFGKGTYPAVTDVRVKLAPGKSAFHRARQLLLGSMALKLPKWTFLGGIPPCHQFSYDAEDAQTGYAVQRHWPCSADYPTALRSLAEAQTVMDAIELSVQAYVAANMGAAANDLDKACRGINDILNAGKGTDGSLMEWNLHNVPYDSALDALLRFAMMFRIPLPGEVGPCYARPVMRGESKPGTEAAAAPQDGWYCTRCGYLFGLNMPPRDGRCPIPTCHNPFTPPVAQP